MASDPDYRLMVLHNKIDGKGHLKEQQRVSSEVHRSRHSRRLELLFHSQRSAGRPEHSHIHTFDPVTLHTLEELLLHVEN